MFILSFCPAWPPRLTRLTRRTACRRWKRAELLKKTAATLREHARHIAGVMMDEVAKPYAAALSEVLRTADLFEFTAEEGVRIGTQFTTCFTKVQMLTQKALLAGELLLSDAFPGEKRNKLALVQAGPTQFTCFTGTKVQILTQKALQRMPLGVVVAIPPYNFLALLVQKYRF